MRIPARPALLAGVGATCLALAACPAPADVEEERDTVDVLREGMPEVEEDPLEDLRRAYLQAYNASDAPGVAELFDRAGVMVTADGELASGRPMVEESLQRIFAEGVPELAIISEEVLSLNGWAADRGSYTLTVRNGADPGAEATVSGRYLSLVREEDGAWRIVWLITNVAPDEREG